MTIDTAGPGLVEITRPVRAWLEGHGTGEGAGQGFRTGLLTVWCRHTSASLLVQENASPDVRRDMQDFFAGLAPHKAGRYRHDDEGPDDMPAHLRAALTQPGLSIPIIAGALALGTWQGIFLFEHRNAPHRRQIALHVMGD